MENTSNQEKSSEQIIADFQSYEKAKKELLSARKNILDISLDHNLTKYDEVKYSVDVRMCFRTGGYDHKISNNFDNLLSDLVRQKLPSFVNEVLAQMEQE